MSFQAMTWAVEQKVPALQKLVLLMLANRLNHDTGKCIPRIKTLADECGMSETSVKSAMRSLADAGLITIVPRFQESVQLPNAYVLHVGVGRNAPPGGSPDAPGVGRQTPTEPGSFNQEEKQAASRGITLRVWLESLKTSGAEAVPATNAVFTYAAKAGIPDSFLALAWTVFKADHLEGAGAKKLQKDWRQTFRNYVEKNYLKLWYVNAEGVHVLTTPGIQAQRVHEVVA